MKRLLAAVMALTVLGGTAATAAPFHPGPFVPGVAHVRHVHVVPAHRVFVRGGRFLVPPHHYVVVHDWHRHYLRRPPMGHFWVRYGHNFLLVSRYNGTILDVRFARV